MNDWFGICFFAFIAAGAYLGLRALSRPVRKTEAEFERSVNESTSMLGASINALQELLNPEAAKSREIEMQMRDGRFAKKKREGKSGGNFDTGGQFQEHGAEQIQ